MYIDFDTGYISNINTIIILTISLIFSLLIAKKLKISLLLVSFLYFWHLVFLIIYYLYSFTARIDTQSYYRGAKDGLLEWKLGNESGAIIIENLTSILIKLFNFSYFNTFLFFHFIGFVGIVFFIKNINQINYKKNKNTFIIIILLLIPSMHFWSNGIGKDPLTFLLTNLFIFSWLKIYKRFGLLILTILFMFFIRPYIGVSMIACSFIGIMLSNNFANKTKILFFIILIIPSLIIIKTVIDRIGFGGVISFQTLSLNMDIFFEYMERRNYVTSLSDTAYTNNFLNPLFNYFFRPTIFDIKNLFIFIISFENLLILLLLLISFINILFSIINKNLDKFNLAILLYFLFTSVILAYSVSNYGLAMRQKWMLMPILLLIIINYFPTFKNHKHSKNINNEKNINHFN